MRVKFTLYTLSVCFCLAILLSCKEEKIEKEPVNNQVVTENSISLDVIKSGVFIKNAEVNEGNIPNATKNFNFTVIGSAHKPDFSSTSFIGGFLNTGFRGDVSSIESINGYYIQFKDLDGNKVDNHFDLAVNDQGSSRFFGVFDEVVRMGSFSFDIAVYSSQGVSQKKEIRVDVREWGGTSSIIGIWKFDKAFDHNDQQIPIDWVDYFFEFSENGDYLRYFKKDYQIVDSDSEENYYYKGKWSFAAKEGELGTIDFSFIDLINPESSIQYDYGSIFTISSVRVFDDELRLVRNFDTNYETSFVFKRIE
ncbi:hypothetical protein [Marivirga harenae]|uniref:hypothetical protein n=1 Tax=Marivirga harenae TaxID=2010992 RepID=UPI0026E0027E|nr:hypothetical protein [Marivirga harenae]WKV12518.1 hypothetical protein Q3Y49_01550 [Marivirga harenae]